MNKEFNLIKCFLKRQTTFVGTNCLNIYVALFLVGVVLFNTGCNKYLDKKSDTGVVVPTTIANLQALLDAANNMNYSTSSYMLGTTDEYFLPLSTYNSQSPIDKAAYKWEPIDYNWQNDWSVAYFSIYNANICLEQIENIPILSNTESQWKNVKGSALFFRAYYFLNLAWAYAKAYDPSSFNTDLGIPLRLVSDFNVASTRANVKNTYDRVVLDAKEASNYLPNLPQHVFRPSKAAAYGLLARTYLSMKQYDSSAKYATLCLGIQNNLINYNDPTFDVNSPNPFSLFNQETIFYTQAYVPFVLAPFSIYGLVDTTIYSSFATNDLRRPAYFTDNGSYKSFKGNYTGSLYIFTGIATDEMYLTRAESYARLGDKSNALADLNFLLSKRYNGTFTPITSTDANDALQKILVERKKELLFRGLRWIDIKRLNKEGANIILSRVIAAQNYTLLPNDSRYALPLPKDVIDQSGIPQN